MTLFIYCFQQKNRLGFSFLFLLISTLSFAQTTSWKGTSSTAWGTAANWTNGVPTTTTNVIVGDANFTGGFQPTLSSAITVNSLTVGGTVTSNLTISRALTVTTNVIINTGGTLTDAGSGSTTTVKGNWENNGTYTANSGQSMIFSGVNQTISGSSATPFGSVTINAGTTVTFNSNFSGAITLNGTLIPDPMAKVTSGTISVGAAGTLHVKASTFSGNYATTPTLAAGSSVVYSALSDQVISNFTYSTLRIKGSGIKSLTTNLNTLVSSTGNGNIYVDEGTLDLSTFTANRGTTSVSGTFSIANGATLRIAGANTFPANYNTITLAANSTVEYYGTSQTIRALNYGNLELSGARGTNSITLANTGTISIAGQFTATDTYTTGGRIVTGSTVLFKGTTTQSIPAFTFNNLTISNTSGTILKGDITVRAALTFTAGKITTDDFNVILPSGGTLTGAAQTTGWVNGNLQKYLSSTAGGTFEIGGLDYYLPVSVSFAAVVLPGSLVASTTSSAHTAIATSAIADNHIARYWTLSNPESGAILFTTANVTFNWNTADNYENLSTSILKVALYGNTSWSYPAANTPAATSIKVSGVSALGDFTVGQACAANFKYAKANFCSSDGTATVVLNAGATSGAFSASPAGLSINSQTGAIALANSAAGTYTITNSITGACATSSTTTVTIALVPSATISYAGSPFCNSGTGSVTRTGTTGGTYSSTTGLVITASTGAIDLATSTAGSYTVLYTIAATASCPQFQTSTVVHVGPAVWKGKTNTDWETTTNWSCAYPPKYTDNVIIPAGAAFYPVVTVVKEALAANLTIHSGASLTVDSGLLSIYGTINRQGTFSVINNGTVQLKGTTAQTLPANTFAGNTVPNFISNNTVSVTVEGRLDITNMLSLYNGTLYTNGYITLKASATKTAQVDQVTSKAASPIVGDITVERYIPGRRKYRLLAPSVTTSDKATLLIGEESRSIWGNWQNSGVNTSGVGTYITGGTAADGFDTQTTSASLYTYNSATRKFVAFSTANGKKTKYTPLVTGSAYYMFVYGDRRNSITTPTPSATILKTTGKLAIGDQPFTTASANPLSTTVGNFALLGNPYQSVVDWKAVAKSNVSNTIWTWDANLNSTGGYVTVTATTTGTITSPTSSLIQVSRYIQPGQAFFVQTTAASPQIVITEASKIKDKAFVNNQVFRTTGTQGSQDATTQPLVAVNLLFTSGGMPMLADGAVAAFDAAFSKEVTEDDGLKMVNSAEGLAFTEKGTLLGINSRPMPQANDTLFITLAKLTKAQYTLEIFGQGMVATTATPLLQDTYLNTVKPLSMADTNRIVFNVVSSDAASSSPNRFRIIYSQSAILPVTFTAVAATKKENQVLVNWTVASEAGISRYEVERSQDGTSFTKAGEVAARGNNGTQAYQWLDANPAAGKNWYRIRSVEGTDRHLYSKWVMVVMNAGNSAIAITPNPAKGQQINLQLKDVEAGHMTALLFDRSGNEVHRQAIEHSGGSARYLVVPKAKLAKGIYYLKLVTKKEEYGLEVMVD